LVHRMHLWFPVAFLLSCLVGVTVYRLRHDYPPRASDCPRLRNEATAVIRDTVNCFLINLCPLVLYLQLLHAKATLGRVLTAATTALLAFVYQGLFSERQRRRLTTAELENEL
jgi:hypothetical protein